MESYIPEKKMYLCLYYGMHDARNVNKFEQSEEIVKSILKRSMTKKRYGGKPLLQVRKLKKTLNKNQTDRDEVITVRVSMKEKNSLKSKAKNRGLELSDYVRMKLFS